MAITSLDIVRRPPTFHHASVDSAFGGTLVSTQVKLPGAQHYARDGYLIVGSTTRANLGQLYDPSAAALAIEAEFPSAGSSYVIVGEKTLSTAASITAATWGRTFSPMRRNRFYAELPIFTSELWWAGDRPSLAAAVKVRDRRLEPLFDRLDQIERGEWDSDLGRMPSKTALKNARTVLSHLSGDTLVPKRVVGGDGLIAVYFTSGEKYSTVEVLNSGALFILNSDGVSIPHVERFKMTQLSAAIDKIRAYVA